jgi:alpha-beta hydrolase superfamily lysophospholipase
MIYSYDTQLHGSISSQDLESLASSLRASIAAQRTPGPSNAESRTVPLIFIAHSLGGLVVKEALIQMKNDKKHQDLFESVYGALFFGVPSQGMEITSLIPMVKSQPNQALLHTLGKESQLLRNQSRDFPEAFDSKDTEIFCYYETEMSRTAKLVSLMDCSHFHLLTFTRRRTMYGRWRDHFAS